MRIGIDCTGVDPSYKGGVNTYVFGLISGFSEVKNNKHKYIIFCTPQNKKVFESYVKNNQFNLVIIKNFNSIIKRFFLIIPYFLNSLKLWEFSMNLFTLILGMKNKIESSCDVLYTPTTILNFYNLNVPTVLSMHDIQQYHYPEFFTQKELKIRKLTFETSAKNANYFQASSYFIKHDLLKNFSWLKDNQIVVIPEGVSIEEFSQENNLNICVKYSLPKEFLFFPAQLWKHKNHITVLKALNKLYNEDNIKIPLVMTGDTYSGSSEILNFIKDNKMDYIHYLGKVDFTDLLALYKEAKFLITAVLYESSSLPILEAAASSLPIIASRTLPNIEMSKNINMNLFEPLSVTECAFTIKTTWNHNEIIKEQVDLNNKKIFLYAWDNIAVKYLKFLESKIQC